MTQSEFWKAVAVGTIVVILLIMGVAWGIMLFAGAFATFTAIPAISYSEALLISFFIWFIGLVFRILVK
jgi:hypothetical protein